MLQKYKGMMTHVKNKALQELVFLPVNIQAPDIKRFYVE